MSEAITPADAARAMKARGIDNPSELLEFATPEAIRGACEWWDRLRGVGPGLLAKKIRDGGIIQEEETPASVVEVRERERRERFAEHAHRFPVGSVAEPHAVLQERCWPGDDMCAGNLIVVEAIYPNLTAECDACPFFTGYPLRAIPVLTARRLTAVAA